MYEKSLDINLIPPYVNLYPFEEGCRSSFPLFFIPLPSRLPTPPSDRLDHLDFARLPIHCCLSECLKRAVHASK